MVIAAKRLNLRLSRRCNCNCEHCTMRDVPPAPDLSFAQALEAAAKNHALGCREIVLMREPSLWESLPGYISALRGIGYDLVQMQTNGRVFSEREFSRRMADAGLTHSEINVFAARTSTADGIMKAPGAQLQVLTGIKNLIEYGIEVLAVVPALKNNLNEMGMLVRLLASLRVCNIQFNFPRPVFADGHWFLDNLPRLEEASAVVRPAMRLADSLGMSVSSEAFPFCHLETQFRRGPDSEEDFSRHVIVDLHITHSEAESHRKNGRPLADVCHTCAVSKSCPMTWRAYQELFGVGELKALSSMEEPI